PPQTLKDIGKPQCNECHGQAYSLAGALQHQLPPNGHAEVLRSISAWKTETLRSTSGRRCANCRSQTASSVASFSLTPWALPVSSPESNQNIPACSISRPQHHPRTPACSDAFAGRLP